jgi:hypothetical protein
MVHRDIKPSNLMLTRQGNRALIKVLDLGLAKVQSEGAVDGGLTHEGQMLGTPDYIAPEQISDARRADTRADIYSLGCTLYYLLTGGPPFHGTSLYDILQAHHSMDAKPLNLARPEVPVELAALVAKMMAKEPERRFQEPKQVAQALLPFFKKGNAGAAGSKAEMSQVGGADEGRVSTGVRTASTQPTTNLAPAPAPSPKTPAATARPQPMWESLIELKENEPLEQSARSTAKPGRQKPRWLWSAVAGGMLLLGLVVAWATILRVKTSSGIIELANLPRDAEVLVDGEEVAVTWPGGGKPAVISVSSGTHKITIKKDGLELSGDELTVQAGGIEKFTVRIVPLADSRRGKNDAEHRLSRREVDQQPQKGTGGTVGTMTQTPPSVPLDQPDTTRTVVADGRDGKAEPSGRVQEDPARPGTLPLKKSDIYPAPVESGDAAHGSRTPVGTVSLFNGVDLDGWIRRDGTPADWPVANGIVTVGTGDIMTSKRFGNFQLHLEFKVPYMPNARGQARGNSGVFLQGMHELQILDSYGLECADNECVAIYKRIAPSVNACKPPLQWQSYDVTFHKARLDQGKIVKKARVTVVHNGITTIDNAEVSPTPGGVDSPPGEDGPLLLQDHGSRVEYRNIWINHLGTSNLQKADADGRPLSPRG